MSAIRPSTLGNNPINKDTSSSYLLRQSISWDSLSSDEKEASLTKKITRTISLDSYSSSDDFFKKGSKVLHPSVSTGSIDFSDQSGAEISSPLLKSSSFSSNELVLSPQNNLKDLGVRGKLHSKSEESSSEEDTSSKTSNNDMDRFNRLIGKSTSSDLDCFFGDVKKTVEKAIKSVTTLHDSPGRQEKSNSINQTLRNLFTRIGKGHGFDTPQFHKEAHKKLTKSDWLSNTTTSLIKASQKCQFVQPSTFPLQIINIEHITKGASNKSNDKSVGFHWCPPESPLRKTLEHVQLNPKTGVFCGYFKLEKEQQPKFSTFFPDEIHSEDELITIIQNSQEITRSGNRSLRKTVGPKAFMLELYLKENGLIIQSAFPIFFFKRVTKDSDPFAICDNLFIDDPKKLIEDAAKFVGKNVFIEENKNPVHFTLDHENGKEIIIDVASLFESDTHIPHGIYLQFPIDYFPDIEKD